LSWDDDSFRRARVSESVHELGTNGSGIILGNTERYSGETNLLNEISDLSVGEIHELVYVVHGVRSSVGTIGGGVLHGASEQSTEVRVQMGDESILVGGSAVGRLVHHERDGSTIIKEVD